MAHYIGNEPSAGEFKHLDSIASQFNGSSVTFALQFNSVSQSVGDATQLIVSLNGVIQEPLTAYTLGTGGSNITFASAPASGDTCFIVMLGGVGNTTTPSDNSVTTAKIAAGAVTSSKISIDGDISFPDNDKAVFGSELEIYSDGTHARIREYGGGQMKIQGNNMQLLTSDGASTYLEGNASTSAVTLYHASNAPRLATTSTGINVTGETYTTSLTVNGSTANRGLSITTATDDVTDNEVIFNAPSAGSGELIFQTVSQERVRIDRSGNVGIGTGSPSYPLDVNGGTENVVARISSTDADALIVFEDNSTTDSVLLGAQGEDFLLRTDLGKFTFRVNNNATDGMVILNNGNVGIGTNNPGTVLHVYNSAQSRIAMENSTRRFDLMADGDGFTIRDQTAAVNRFRIDTSGNAIPTTDAAYDLGSTSFRWNNVYTTDLQLSNMGKEGGNDVDGTTGNWTLQEGAEDLFIINNNTGKKYRIPLEEVV